MGEWKEINHEKHERNKKYRVEVMDVVLYVGQGTSKKW